MTKVIRPLASRRFSLTDDTIKTCASSIWFLFRLQGIFAEDEQHPCLAESPAGIGSWIAPCMPSQQQPDWLKHWSTALAVAATRLMPSIATKRQATIFPGNEFISVKTQVGLINRIICHIVVVVNKKYENRFS